MAKTKKKTDGIKMEMPGTMGSAKIVLPKEKKKTKPRDLSSVVKGSHLTVTTDAEGRTTLVWDDEALLRDVRLAILTAESKIPVATETKPKKKAADITVEKKKKTKKQ
jgi:hypothetical protein